MTVPLSKNKKRVFGLITFILTLLICMISFEIVVQIFFPQSNLRIGDSAYFRYEPVIGFEGIPNVIGIMATNQYKTAVLHNSKGFRDIEHDYRNVHDKYRILALGEDFTWGTGVNYNEIYLKVLEQIGQNIETINMGWPSLDPPGGLTLYQQRGLKYEHDLLMTGLYMGSHIVTYYPDENDSPPRWGYNSDGEFVLIGKVQSEEVVKSIRKQNRRKYSPNKYRGPIGRLHYWLIQNFQFYTFIDNFQDYHLDALKSSPAYIKLLELLGIQKERSMGFLIYCLKEAPPEIEHGREILSGILKTLKKHTSDAGARLYIVMIPHVLQTSRPLFERTVRMLGYETSRFDLEKPNRSLAELCEKYDIDYLDLLPALKRETRKGKVLYYPRDPHWTAEAHRIAAIEIYADMRKRGWIK